MPVEILKRPQALRDIEECFVYIAEDSLEIGVCFIVAVEDSLQQISQFPFIGKERVFKNTHFRSVRMWHAKILKIILFFISLPTVRLEIIRVLYRSRDIEEIFT